MPVQIIGFLNNLYMQLPTTVVSRVVASTRVIVVDLSQFRFAESGWEVKYICPSVQHKYLAL